MQNDVRTLRIDPTVTSPVPEYVFGHNLEHTRACVSGGLSAQMLRNRKFAGRPQARLGVAAEWFPIGDTVYYCNDTSPYVRHEKANGMWRRNDLNAQTIQNAVDGQTAGIGQDGLRFESGKEYLFALTAKSASPVEMTVALTDLSGDRVYARETFLLAPGDWTRRELTLIPRADDDRGCLRVTFHRRAEVIVGAVSLLPADNFHGMRRDVVERLKDLGVSVLRWPGGNFAGEYRWRDMFLPVDQRAPLQAYTEDETQPYTHGYDMHEIDTDDFVALCREIGAEPFITINLAWDTPEDSAAWVEYCNGPADSPYGRLRAQRGHAQPYGVRFWSLGNEMGYGHMEGPMEPDKYASMARASAEAMKAVSPDLILCSSGPYGDGRRTAEWVGKSAVALRPEASLISFHTYNNLHHDYTSEEGMRNTYIEAMRAVDGNFDALRALRREVPEDIQISWDEWNVWAAWYRRSGALEGVYAARMLQTMLALSDQMGTPVMCYFQPVGEGAIDVLPGGAVLSAIGQAFELMKAHRGGRLCRVEGAERYEALASIRGGAVTLTLINDDHDDARRYAIGCPRGRFAKGHLLTAESLLPGTRFTGRVLVAEEAQGLIDVTLPPRSVACLTIDLTETGN